MTTAVSSCSECGSPLVSDAIYCPHCLIDRLKVKESWFPISGEGLDNTTVNHTLVPEHRVVPEERVTQLCREYSIDRTDLPRIKSTDPAIQHLACEPGDVIEIIRDSRTTDTARSYRLIISGSGGTSSTSAQAEWRNPAGPAETTYSRTAELNDASVFS